MVHYTGKFVLAPMVRVSELPTRLLALRHGADLVWGPEIIDKKIITLKRVENKQSKTIDFVHSNERIKKGGEKVINTSVAFRTCRELEHGKLIFQMGTSNPELAVKAAKIIINDVDGIDINAGCPKHFSIHAGMGAALLKTPDLLCEILTKLVSEVGKPNNKPISVKIRILETKEQTIELVKRLVTTGISNLSVHCRRREMRNREDPIRDYVPYIIPICKEHNVSLILNGGIKGFKDFKAIQEEYGSEIGAMIASAAEINPTVFAEEPLTWAQTTKEFLEICKKFDHHHSNVKFCLSRIVPGKSKLYQAFLRCKTLDEMVEVSKSLKNDGTIVEEKKSDEQKKRKLENDLDEDSEAKKVKLVTGVHA